MRKGWEELVEKRFQFLEKWGNGEWNLYLEDKDRGAFSNDESVTGGVKGAGCLIRTGVCGCG